MRSVRGNFLLDASLFDACALEHNLDMTSGWMFWARIRLFGIVTDFFLMRDELSVLVSGVEIRRGCGCIWTTLTVHQVRHDTVLILETGGLR